MTITDTSTPAPLPTATAWPPTPGWKTSEFWLKVGALVLTSLFASGVIPTSGPAAQVAAIAATMLGALGYTVGRSLVKAAGAAVLALVVLSSTMQTGCGGSQASRSATISSVDSALRAAVATLRTYEHIQAEAVIAKAKNLDDGRAGLAALRARTTTAWRAIDAALAALDSANTVNDDPTVKGAQRALSDAMTAIAALTSTPAAPGGTP